MRNSLGAQFSARFPPRTIPTHRLPSQVRGLRALRAEAAKALSVKILELLPPNTRKELLATEGRLVARAPLAALTPEFLNLLFQRQERLGEAQLQELNALVAYNLAIAELHRVTGTGLDANRIDLVVTDAVGGGR